MSNGLKELEKASGSLATLSESLGTIAGIFSNIAYVVKIIIAFLANLEPRLLRGQMSQGMILAATDGEHPYAILTVDRKLNNNAKVS